MKREEQAVMYNQGRNNCCQSVLLAYADRLKLSEEELRSLGAAFGAGMGGMEGNCGALWFKRTHLYFRYGNQLLSPNTMA